MTIHCVYINVFRNGLLRTSINIHQLTYITMTLLLNFYHIPIETELLLKDLSVGVLF